MMAAGIALLGLVFWGLIHLGVLSSLLPYAFGEIHQVVQP